MIEPEGELKFKLVNELTVEVSADNFSREWTCETLEHALIQLDKEEQNINHRRAFYSEIYEKALKLGIKTEQEVAEIKRKAEEKRLAEEKKLADKKSK